MKIYPLTTPKSVVAVLSVSETGLGSFLHAFHVPLAGQFLSLNQVLLLSHYCKSANALKISDPAQISFACACLKVVSPGGKKLTPMAAISTQGLLFSFGLFCLGKNLYGVVLGSVLLSIWAFVQPFLTYTIFFGFSFWTSVLNASKKIFSSFHLDLNSHRLILLLVTAVTVKAALAVSIALFSNRLPLGKWIEFIGSFKKMNNNNSVPSKSDIINSLRELLNPLFIISWIFSILLFYFDNKPDLLEIVWIILRPLGIGFIIFYFFRKINLNQFNISRVK